MNFVIADMPLPVFIRPEGLFTDEDLQAFCAANDELRVERTFTGELRVMSPAGSGTAAKNSEINFQLMSWSRTMGRGIVFDSSAGFVLSDGSMLSPDAAWMSDEKWNALSAEEQARFAPACPEFVIELRSPSDRLTDLKQKMEQWIANGAGLAWLVDPIEAAVWIYRPNEATEVHHGVSSVRGDGPMLGFELLTSRIWA